MYGGASRARRLVFAARWTRRLVMAVRSRYPQRTRDLPSIRRRRRHAGVCVARMRNTCCPAAAGTFDA